ncbi:Cell division protein FtsX [Candidatus Hydrogenisulfobacillus filiaventi]|uniref:Cell division protein FtsX n=1 Tax=Candidatus Hydrogenisulfobacillus filiaventi TaxID=2707344 RepID=A0A6F8ZI73_9FIRM|nr:permease-like cell division protein FtsX [Bacillota bacterium]CAB1129352.1 Cell division protein FtsX [Candidatus Hydrogenisulfobacillus filiaventi]
MRLRTACHHLRDAGRSLGRNRWMTLASVGTVAVALFVLAFFLALTANINHLTATLESQVEVEVFLKPQDTRAQEMALLAQARRWPGVRAIRYFTKQQAAEALKREFPHQRDLIAILTQSNPLFDGFDVYVTTPAAIAPLAHRFAAQPPVHNVVYQGRVVTRLERLAAVLRSVGLALEVLLGLGALFIIVNTIRLAVYARRREIGIMKLVGATDWHIRWPFLIEGAALGLAGAGVADLVAAWGYHWVVRAAAEALPFWPLASSASVIPPILEVTGLGGLAVGVAGSLLAVHRFLKV